ncbi:hypothetical protein FRB95_000042 [Tulasnella sp. JGI-2019a]|nr:hypothetical protein FRB95_000042 [Tulasnella sp. JGI-2019a]
MGGLGLYQEMSVTGQRKDRGGGSEKILIGWLRDLQANTCQPPSVKGKERADPTLKSAKLRLLEVGALLPDNYAGCSSWIDCYPIDLRSRHPEIKEQDFMLLDQERNHAAWDLISLSLVLNFVGDPYNRGNPKLRYHHARRGSNTRVTLGSMLRLAHKFLRPDTGLLFIVLPLPCVSNSRYLDLPHFRDLMAAIGFRIEKERWKESGKVGYWLFRATGRRGPDDRGQTLDFSRKRVVREGGGRNNFSILL